MTGTKQESFTIPSPVYLEDLLSRVKQEHAVFAVMLPTMQIVVDGVPTQENLQLEDETEVDFIPLYTGG